MFLFCHFITTNNYFLRVCSNITAVTKNDLICSHDSSGDSDITFVNSTTSGLKSEFGPSAKYETSALSDVQKTAIFKKTSVHSDSNRSLTGFSIPTKRLQITEDSKSKTACGSSKRKRKLPVQYIRGAGIKSENTDHSTEDTVEDRAEENGYISRPSNCSILQADKKKSFTAFSLGRITTEPDIDDVLTSAEPQPKTTICYKPFPTSDIKGKDLSEAQKNNKEHVAGIVRKMQEDLEVQELSADKQNCDEKSFCSTKISFRPTGPQTSQSDAPNVTVGQTYNLDLFRRIVGKSQVKDKESEKISKQFTSESSSASHDPGSSSAWLKWMMKSSQPQRNCAGEQYSPNQSRAISPHQLNRYWYCAIKVRMQNPQVGFITNRQK